MSASRASIPMTMVSVPRSRVLRLDGAADEFIITLLSCPVYTAMPTTHSVLRSDDPRGRASHFSTFQGVQGLGFKASLSSNFQSARAVSVNEFTSLHFTQHTPQKVLTLRRKLEEGGATAGEV
jgi:hypothetical protein